MDIVQILKQTNLPVAYGRFMEAIEPPFLVYMGAGQYDFAADDTYYHKRDQYRVEYYFTIKSKEAEAAIEQILLDSGYLYEKSEDIYLDDEKVFAIYYYI